MSKRWPPPSRKAPARWKALKLQSARARDAATGHGQTTRRELDQSAPVASPKELGDYDAILFGTPTRFGNMAAQMRNFLDQTGGLWVKGALVGKVGSVFTSTGTGAETRAPS